MTEIQWIIHLMTGFQLPEEVKRLCLERIGEVEKRMTERVIIPAMNHQPMIQAPIPVAPLTPPISAAQARDMAMNQPASVPQPIPKQPTQEIVTGVGNGTQIRGKRKF